MKYLQESAELICTLPGAVQREVYGARVAESAKISAEAMKMEIDRARKRLIAREKKRQEKIDLAPAQALQPKSRNIRYDNMKSAMAEERVIALALKAPDLLDKTDDLKAEAFSSPLLAKVYGQLRSRHDMGLEASLAVLDDLSPEEMSHVAGVVHRNEGPVNEQVLNDCIRTIRTEHQLRSVTTDDDLLAMSRKMKERKGVKA